MYFKIILYFLILILLTGCGGGGGAAETENIPVENNYTNEINQVFTLLNNSEYIKAKNALINIPENNNTSSIKTLATGWILFNTNEKKKSIENFEKIKDNYIEAKIIIAGFFITGEPSLENINKSIELLENSGFDNLDYNFTSGYINELTEIKARILLATSYFLRNEEKDKTLINSQINKINKLDPEKNTYGLKDFIDVIDKFSDK